MYKKHKGDDVGFMAIARVNDPEMLNEAETGNLTEWTGIRHVVSTIDNSIKRLQTGLQCIAFEEVVNNACAFVSCIGLEYNCSIFKIGKVMIL